MTDHPADNHTPLRPFDYAPIDLAVVLLAAPSLGAREEAEKLRKRYDLLAHDAAGAAAASHADELAAFNAYLDVDAGDRSDR